MIVNVCNLMNCLFFEAWRLKMCLFVRNQAISFRIWWTLSKMRARGENRAMVITQRHHIYTTSQYGMTPADGTNSHYLTCIAVQVLQITRSYLKGLCLCLVGTTRAPALWLFWPTVWQETQRSWNACKMRSTPRFQRLSSNSGWILN